MVIYLNCTMMHGLANLKSKVTILAVCLYNCNITAHLSTLSLSAANRLFLVFVSAETVQQV